MGLSLLAMLLAVAGYLPALAGAIVQEVIDLAVIGNTLRALGAGWRERAAPTLTGEWIDSLRQEHAALLPLLERLRAAAEGLDDMSPGQAREELAGLVEALECQLIPHEQADEDSLYPQLASACRATIRSPH